MQERISFHRQQLKQRLGLTAQGKVFSTGVDQLFDDSDLLIQSTYSPSAPDPAAKAKVHKLQCHVLILIIIMNYYWEFQLPQPVLQLSRQNHLHVYVRIISAWSREYMTLCLKYITTVGSPEILSAIIILYVQLDYFLIMLLQRIALYYS